MACQNVTLPDGARAIVCGPTQRCKCGRRATLLCDWKVPAKGAGSDDEAIGHKKATCDAPLCERCATSPAPEKDLCPAHAREWEAWKARRGAA